MYVTLEEASEETETVSLARVCIKNMCKCNAAPDQMFFYYLLLLIFKRSHTFCYTIMIDENGRAAI